MGKWVFKYPFQNTKILYINHLSIFPSLILILNFYFIFSTLKNLENRQMCDGIES